jgi:hypothetical protein
VGRLWVVLVAAVVVVGAGLAVAALSRRDEPAPKPAIVPAASQRGEDADLMRRLQRKKLVRRDH